MACPFPLHPQTLEIHPSTTDSIFGQESRTEKTQHSPNPPGDMPPLPNLPLEIIADILSRLPVKSLLQFRCVCKSWRSLISDPQFVKAQLCIASASNDYTNYRLILSSTRPHFNLKSCSLHSVLYDQCDTAISLDYPFEDPHHSDWIVGSCNGLVCVAIKEDNIFLWNPSTRKSKILPDPAIKKRVGGSAIYGFGYDESKDDYKVVGMFWVGGGGSPYETEVKVYSLKTHSWRRIKDFPNGFSPDDSGKFANGALHWVACGDSGQSDSWVIVSLDLSTERYGKVAQLGYGNDEDVDLTLGVLGGCLCVLCNYCTSADVWVMKEYGVRESWTKLAAVSYLASPLNFQHYKPLCISRNGEILLKFKSILVLFNPKNGTFRRPVIQAFCGYPEVCTYIGSLVSPYA